MQLHSLNLGSGTRQLKTLQEEILIAKDHGVHVVIADRVFLCGKIEISGVMLIEANELFLLNAEIDTIGLGLPMQIFTQTLQLEGNSRLAVKGISTSEVGNPGGGIALTVTKSIAGTGKLLLMTEGGDQVATQLSRARR